MKIYDFFLDRRLSIMTVAKIKDPPKKVFKEGISLKKKKASIIPKSGCVLAIILAVLAEKCFKLFKKRVCPTAVVSNASNST